MNSFFVPWLGPSKPPDSDSLEDTRAIERAESEGWRMLTGYGHAVDRLADAE